MQLKQLLIMVQQDRTASTRPVAMLIFPSQLQPWEALDHEMQTIQEHQISRYNNSISMLILISLFGQRINANYDSLLELFQGPLSPAAPGQPRAFGGVPGVDNRAFFDILLG